MLGVLVVEVSEERPLGIGVVAPGILAVVRRTSDETLLVLANLSDEAVDGFTLDLDAGLPCGATFTSAETIFGAATATPPVVTAGGRFAAYAPLRGLGPKESVVIRLSP